MKNKSTKNKSNNKSKSLKVRFYYQTAFSPSIHPAQVVKLAGNGYKFVRVVNYDSTGSSVIIFSNKLISTRQAKQRANKELIKVSLSDFDLDA